jgi:hypothetical protein
MRAWMVFPLVAAIGLAGCQQASAPGGENVAANTAEPQATGNGQAGSNVAAEVVAMNDRQRNVVLVRALMDAGLPCQGVQQSTRMQDQDGLPMWRATCTDGTSHMVTITRDGTANIVSRTDR